MQSIKLSELSHHYDQKVVVSGFVENIRNLQWVQFLVLNDGTGKVQVTIEKSDESNQEMISVVNSLTLESTVKITGVLKENSKVKLNGMEIIPSILEVTSHSEEELPFSYRDLTGVNFDTRLDYRFIDLRNEKNSLIFKIQSSLVQYMREYLYQRDFMEIHTPKLIGTASESGSDVFEVKYFDRLAYLAQSPQFYKQMAMSSGFNRIFEVGPAFRAENSNTSRHATEYTCFDVEFSYIDSYYDVMKLESEMLTYALEKVNHIYGERIKDVYGVELVVPTLPFPVMKLCDVYQELESRYGYKVEESEKDDLTTEAEKLCHQLSKDKFQHEFLFVTHYPASKRAFYHMRDNEGVLQGYDLLWRGVEITTGAQREHRYEEITKNAQEKGLTKDVEFYLQFFKYGCPPHGGFGLGVDRLTMLLLGISSIKEVQFLFRGPNRIEP